jgi:hypothetical protein
MVSILARLRGFSLMLAVAIAFVGAGPTESHAAPKPKPILDFQLSFREPVICGFVVNIIATPVSTTATER